MVQKFNPHSLPYYNPAKDRRVALITGGNSGIGFYTVLHLYLHGFVIYIAGRSKSRVQKSIKELHQHAHAHRSSYPSTDQWLGEVHFLELDLSRLASVVQAAGIFANLEKCLHILINNAGIMGLPYQPTVDGFDIQLQTNYVAPFLLTTKLLPMLERTADLYPDKEPPRILYLSSIGHHFAFRYFGPNTTFDLRPALVFSWLRYGVAKTAGIHFVKMLALRNPRVLSVAVHPGFVMNANLFAYWTSMPIIGLVFWCWFHIIGFFFGVLSETGAHASVKCCLDPTLTVEKDNGKYFATNGVESLPSKVAGNMDYAARTWIWTVHELGQRHYDI